MTIPQERAVTPEERFYYGEPDAPSPNMPITPGVSGVIFDSERRILFMKRSLGEYWSLPGGRLDIGESAHACCVRETLEETGLQTRIVRIVSVNSDPRSISHYPDGNIYQAFVVCFELEVISGDLRKSAESEAFRWCGPQELQQIKLVHDSLQNALDAWANRDAAFIR